MNAIALTFLHTVLTWISPATFEGRFTIETGSTTQTLTDLTGVIAAEKDKSAYSLSLVAEESKDENRTRVDFHISDIKQIAPGEYKIEPSQSKTKFGIVLFNDGPKDEPTVSLAGEKGKLVITALRVEGQTGFISGTFEFTGKNTSQNKDHTVKGSFEDIHIAVLP